MLFPKKVKHRKWQKGRSNPKKVKNESRGITVSFGSYGAKAQTAGAVNSQQIEAARKVVRRTIGKFGRMWIRIFPDRPYTQKAAETPMGKGKGDVQGYQADIYPGRIIFEVDGVSEEVAREAFRKAGTKLPVKLKLVSRA